MTQNNTRVFVAVGSENKAKLLSVTLAVEKLFPDSKVTINGFTVNSGVSNQPMSDGETVEGARNRAQNALKQAANLFGDLLSDYDFVYGVGLEGGVQKVFGEQWFESGWICVQDWRTGKRGFGSSGRFELSSKIMKRLITGGQELAQVIDDLSGREDVRSADGAMGVLTNGQLPRAEAYLHGVLFAFSPFVSPLQYWL